MGKPPDEPPQTELDLTTALPVEAPKKRGKRRRRGSIEVLDSGAVRVRIRGVSLPDGRTVEVAKTITEGASIAWRMEEAQRRVRPALEKRALDLECGLASYDAGTTLAECVTRLRQSHALRWRRADDTMWKRLRPAWNMPLANIDASAAAALLAKWEKDGHSAAYRRNLFGLLRRVLGLAAVKGMLGRVPIWPRGMLPPKKETKRGMAAKLRGGEKHAVFEAARVIDVERGTDLADRLAFQLDLGLRPIECAWARVEDLREESDGWHFYPSRAKGSGLAADEGADRLFVQEALARRVLGRLDVLPARARALGVLFPQRLPRGVYAPRWSEERGTRAAHAWITEAEVTALRSRSGVSGFFPYMMRHTRMWELADAGASEAQLQRFGAWSNAEMVSVYKGTASNAHPAMLAPSAPTPGASALRVLDSPSGRTAIQPAATANGPAMPGQSGPGVNPLGSDMGADGRGPAVGGGSLFASMWSAMGASERAAVLESARVALREAAEWPSLPAAVSALVRRRGVEGARALLDVLELVSAVGAAGPDGPRLAGLCVALRSRVVLRGSIQGSATPKKSTNLRLVGAAAGCPSEGIDTPPPGSGKAPRNRPKK